MYKTEVVNVFFTEYRNRTREVNLVYSATDYKDRLREETGKCIVQYHRIQR